MIDRKIINKVRKVVEENFPGLHFKIRKINFSSLNGEAYFLESGHWGMVKGNNEMYQKVKKLVASITPEIIVSW